MTLIGSCNIIFFEEEAILHSATHYSVFRVKSSFIARNSLMVAERSLAKNAQLVED